VSQTGPHRKFLPDFGQEVPFEGSGAVKVAGTGILGERKVNGRCLTMNEPQAERLEMRWLPVIDAFGRTRMEATWVAVPTTSAQESAASHAA
jgi:hypothetical protein